ISSTRSSESAFKSSWKEASIVTCSGSQPSRSTTMFLKSSKLSFWVSNLASSAASVVGGLPIYSTSTRKRPPPRGARAPAARAPSSESLCGGLGAGRCHAQLGHDLDLVVHQRVSLHEAAVDFEDLHELPTKPAAGRRHLTHRGLQRP